MMTHIGYVIVIRGGRSGSFSGLFGISCSVQIFEDSVRIWITNLNWFVLNPILVSTLMGRDQGHGP